MKKTALLLLLLLLVTATTKAQRMTDQLDRGLIAMKVSGGVYLNWRILAEEYFDVKYNVYRDGTLLNAEPLSISNYTDKGGKTSNTYTVAAVIGGQVQTQCAAVKPWTDSYKEIKLTHEGIKSTLVPNDACCADVDGDGELEILLKFDNLSEIQQSYPKNGPTIDGVATKEYSIMECLKLDGTRLWWVNCGPNMGDFQNNEQNIVAFDWDQDGRAEVVMRACDGTTIHMADGKTYTVGNASSNVRGTTGGGVNWFVCTNGEYLLYMDGLTGKPYQCLPYPLPILESGETNEATAWGDKNWTHRASKHFFGAPFLDGRKPSIFLARGIYTRHKMIAYDVNPSTHTLKERWRWFNNTNGPWKGQGYHNYCVADVDMDGRDEIVFGSMVIDDNGKGLSTTGFGHGDAQHVGDLNPYAHGLEVFSCMEDNPGTNYRDATTSKVYFRYQNAPKDVGRCMAGNFSNSYPGAICVPTGGSPLNAVTAKQSSALTNVGINENMRIYWDGDLCEETFNYLNGENTEGCVAKYGSWSPIYTCAGSQTNNGTKGTPCYQGDILGDWREEIIMRTAQNNIRIYSTPTPTEWRIPSLWYDHQYRNAMVWQMCGYNQPPHLSYFLGELEDITIAPPPLTMTNRTEVSNNGTIGSSLNGQHVIVCETGNTSVTIEAGAHPQVLTFNVPTWVQGTAVNESTNKDAKINYITYTCTVNGGGISGNGRLVKQGDGILTLPKADFTHTGATDIWGGTLNFDGSMKKSPLWLNRHTQLNSDGGEFLSIKADYGATIRPGGIDHQGVITTGEMELGFGSRLAVDLYSDGLQSDVIKTKKLKIVSQTGAAWTQGGPEYLKPVIELKGHLANGEQLMAAGKYVIAEAEQIEGDVSAIVLEGIEIQKKEVYFENGKLIVEIIGMRDPAAVTWNATNSTRWDVGDSFNFVIGADNEPTAFVSGDEVTFNDNASVKNVNIYADVYPSKVIVDNTASYTLTGKGAIRGTAQFIKENTGTVTIDGENDYSGGNHLRGGTVSIKKLSNIYSATGNLGAITTNPDLFTMENGAVLKATAAVEQASPMKMIGDDGGVLNNNADFRMNAALSGTTLTKQGSGSLFLMQAGTLQKLVLSTGAIALQNNSPVKNIELQNGTLWDDVQSTTHGIHVPKGKSATWQLTYTYYTAYNNKLTGSGTLTIIPRNTVSRVRIVGNWTDFEGTVKHTNKDIWLPLDMSGGMPKGTLDIAEGCSVTNVCKEFTIGKLTGKGSLAHAISNFQNQSSVSGNNTWNIGNDDLGDFTFAGTITDAGGTNKCIFNKIGTCKMTVSGKSNHNGNTTIKKGELKLMTGAQIGKGALTVNNGAILSGATSSSVPLANSSVVIEKGGTVHVGLSATSFTGAFYFGGKNVNFQEGSILELGINSPATTTSTGGTSIQNIGQLTINATIRLYYPEAGTTLAVGDSIVLWKNVTKVAGKPVLESDVIDGGKGLYWDTTDLNRGILRVIQGVVNGISMATADSKQGIYDLRGNQLATPRRGLNIIRQRDGRVRKVHIK